MRGLPPEVPVIVQREAQPYAGITGLVTMQHISEMADRIPVLLRWLGERGIPPAGPPFLKYSVIGMEGQLEIEAGIPVAAAVAGAGEVRAGVLPAGGTSPSSTPGSRPGWPLPRPRCWPGRRNTAWSGT